MIYVALDDFSAHLKRVKARAFREGHNAPESVLRDIHEPSLRNLPRAIREMDTISVFDNSAMNTEPRVFPQAEAGEVTYLADRVPNWLHRTLATL